MSNETKDANKVYLSRRRLLKLTAAGVLGGATTFLLPRLRSAHAAQTGTRSTKVLIIYYSRSGNTREIANQIHEKGWWR